MTYPRLKESVHFGYMPSPTEVMLIPYFVCARPLQPKELVFKLVLQDPSNFAETARGWAHSRSVGGRFAYAPQTKGPGLLRLPEIRLVEGSSRVGLVPLRWLSEGADPADLVTSVWCIRGLGQEATSPEPTEVATMWERQ